jgi:hypothetical protein
VGLRATGRTPDFQVEPLPIALFWRYWFAFSRQALKVESHHILETAEGFLAIGAVVTYVQGGDLGNYLVRSLVLKKSYPELVKPIEIRLYTHRRDASLFIAPRAASLPES